MPGTQVSQSSYTFNSLEIADFLYKTTEMWPLPSSAPRFMRLAPAARHVGADTWLHLRPSEGTKGHLTLGSFCFFSATAETESAHKGLCPHGEWSAWALFFFMDLFLFFFTFETGFHSAAQAGLKHKMFPLRLCRAGMSGEHPCSSCP